MPENIYRLLPGQQLTGFGTSVQNRVSGIVEALQKSNVGPPNTGIQSPSAGNQWLLQTELIENIPNIYIPDTPSAPDNGTENEDEGYNPGDIWLDLSDPNFVSVWFFTGDIANGGRGWIEYWSVDEIEKLNNDLSWKEAVVVATTTSGTLATDFENGDTVDGITILTGDRILIKDQSTASENGIHIVQASGTPTRADDFYSGYMASGAAVIVEQGDQNQDSLWLCTNDEGSDVVGTDGLMFVRYPPKRLSYDPANIGILSGGVFTGTGTDGNLVVTSESGTSDDMIEVTGYAIGDVIWLRAAGGHTITVKHDDAGATEKIYLYNDADLVLDEQNTLALRKVSSTELVQDIDQTGGASDASDVTFTPLVLDDWNLGADPGDVDDALDQLAERVTDNETDISTHTHDASDIPYTPFALTDWDFDADPGDVNDALDQLADRVDDIETSGGSPHAPTHITGAADEIDGDKLDIDWNPTNYTPDTTPSEVTSADHLTAHLYGLDFALGGRSLVNPSRSDLYLQIEFTDYQPAVTSGFTTKLYLVPVPELGNVITLLDGSTWKEYTLDDYLTISLSGLTAGKNYDVFGYVSGGAIATEYVAWTNDLTRATAIVPYSSTAKVEVKSGDTSKKFLGTFRAAGTGSISVRNYSMNVWNNYNRIAKRIYCYPTWNGTYTSTTWRTWGADTTVGDTRIELVNGSQLIDKEALFLMAHAVYYNSSEPFAGVAFAMDATTLSAHGNNHGEGGFRLPLFTEFNVDPTPGYHYYQLMQMGGSSGTSTWYSSSFSGGSVYRTAITGSYKC